MEWKVTAQCPAAALAGEAQRLIDVTNAADTLSFQTLGNVDRKLHFDLIEKATIDFLDGVLDRVTFLRAESARGALFQLSAINHFMGDLDDCVSRKDSITAEQVGEKIIRLLYSIAGYIENTSDARLEDSCGQYFMARGQNPHAYIDEAVSILGAKSEA